MNAYELAKEQYAGIGIDTEKALNELLSTPISMHCWQGDDVIGFDHDGGLSGGIQTTGNYPGKARTPKELMADLDLAFSLIGGRKKLNLHANYAIFEKGGFVDRDRIEPKHFRKWVEFAKERGMGIDFNPTLFSHEMAADSLTLSSPDERVRRFWIDHVKCCIRISQYFAEETGIPCVMNIWMPDGYKDIPADRLGPRIRLKAALDDILSIPYDREKVYVTLESKVFGIGLESFTVCSAEFALNYAAKAGIVPLMDNGHYHPTEVVSEKISSMLAFYPKLGLHITRSVRWDSDHVVRLDDETKEIAKEIVASGRISDIAIALDYFDASINRVAAWVIGMRSLQKALLIAMLTPHAEFTRLQNEGNFTKLMALQEELKSFPSGAVWAEFCRRSGVPADAKWFDTIEKYEKEVLFER